jgi:hypothetical protein
MPANQLKNKLAAQRAQKIKIPPQERRESRMTAEDARKEAKKLQELNVVFHHPVDYCPDQLPLIREKLLQYLYQPREAYTHRLYYTESQDRTDQDDPYPHAFVRGGWSSDMHLKIGAVLFNEKLDTPSQQVVDVAVCEDFQDYRGDDQVRGFVQS